MARTVAFVGFGRFGRALAERWSDIGHAVRAYDPHASVPPAIATASMEELLAGDPVVVLAVPVAAFGDALEAARPHLGAGHLVIDVGSVKCGPVAVMERTLGSEVPWVATHPLFGPTSLALGERPLRAIVCPNPLHPSAAETAAALYRSIGCEILEQDPESHDQRMADSHALAYFVAKGFLDAGIDLDSDYVPPSARAIGRVVEAAREDAAHLFATLHRKNAYAEEARRKLLESLTAADAALRAPAPAGEQAHHEADELRIADLADRSPQLKDARSLIDEIDERLIDLLLRRAEVALRAAKAKAELGHAVHDPEREKALLGERRRQATDMGLDEEAVDEIFRAVLRFSRRHQTHHTPGP